MSATVDFDPESNPHVPRWAHGPHHPGWVETIHGVKDFVGQVETNWTEEHPGVGVLPDDIQRGLPQPRHAVSVDAFIQPADSWGASVWTLNQSMLVVREREDRTRVVVTNWGPGIAYLSNDSSANVNGAVQIPVNGSREFRTRGQIYAFGSGTIPVIDVQDEWGVIG